MASVLVVRKTKKGDALNIAFKLNGKRRHMFLGTSYSRAYAKEIAVYVEEIIQAGVQGIYTRRLTSWLGGISDDLQSRLEKAGLIAQKKSITNSELWDLFTDSRTDMEDSTLKSYHSVQQRFLKFFNPDGDPNAITHDDGKKFMEYLKQQKYAPATVSTTFSKIIACFNWAIEMEKMNANPFAKIRRPSQTNPDKHKYIGMDIYQRLLDACWRDNHTQEEQQEMRTFLALLRIGGLRCPSEILPAKWSDVLWEQGDFLVHSQKTKRFEGKDTRMLPLFPLLRIELENLYKIRKAEDRQPDSYILLKWRGTGAYLSKRLKEIQLLAGITPWPDAFQNFRRSRATEVHHIYGAKAESTWIGHGEDVAMRHYLQITPDVIARAKSEDGDFVSALKKKYEFS